VYVLRTNGLNMSEQVNIDPELVDNHNNIILSDDSSSDDSSSDDSSNELDEFDILLTHSIPGYTKIHELCSKSTCVKLELADNKYISTEFEFVRYFFGMQMSGVIADESDDESDESDDDADPVIEFNVQHMTEDLYMKHGAEFYTLCDRLKKMYVYNEETDADVVTYSIIKDMDENGVPKYCQDWIKSKRLLDLEMYGSSTTDDTNLLVRFGCSVLAEFINYWFAYLCIHEDIALLYCDKSYYAELSKVFNEMIGVYKF